MARFQEVRAEVLALAVDFPMAQGTVDLLHPLPAIDVPTTMTRLRCPHFGLSGANPAQVLHPLEQCRARPDRLARHDRVVNLPPAAST
jgi:hypothetical protein